MTAAITYKGEQLIANCQASNKIMNVDRIVLANIPNLDHEAPVDRNEQLPSADKIILDESVSNSGYINPNLVVYSLMLPSGGNSFDFNWMGLISSETNTVVAISYMPTQSKDPSVSMTRNFLLEYSGAMETGDIHISAESWQIDFTARLNGCDERIRQVANDALGKTLFYGDSCLVQNNGNGSFSILDGHAYVAGVKFQLQKQSINIYNKPTSVWLDVSQEINALSDLEPVVSITVSNEDKKDYVDKLGIKHWLTKVAYIDEYGVVTDLRIIYSIINRFSKPYTHYKNCTVYIAENTELNHSLTFDNVCLTGSGILYGSGEVKGTVTNISDLSLLDVKTNIVKQSDRSNFKQNADIILDPLGIDGNIDTFTKALDHVKVLINSGRITDIVVLVRAGIVEIPETVISSDFVIGEGQFNVSISDANVVFGETNIFFGQTYSGNIIFKNYPGEKPVITPIRTYVSCRGASIHNGTHYKIANTTGVYANAYDACMKKIPISTNYDRQTRKLPRITSGKILTAEGVDKFRFRPTDSDMAGIAKYGLDDVYLRVTQNYTSSWHTNLLLSDGYIEYTSPGAHPSYYDGYYYANKKAAPYMLTNAVHLLENDTYCCKKDYWYIPRSESGFYVTEETSDFLLDIKGSGIIFSGIDYAATGHPISEFADKAGSAHPRGIGVINSQDSKNLVIERFSANDIEGCFIQTSDNPSIIRHFTLRDVGLNPVVSTVNGNRNIHIHDFLIENFGHMSVSSIGVYPTGRDIHVHHGIIRHGAWAALRADSAAYTVDKTDDVGGKLHDLVMYNIGMRDGVPDELYISADTGIFTTNGRNYSSNYHLYDSFLHNIVGHSRNERSLFFDDGVHGMRVARCVCGSAAGPNSVDIRQVNDNTYNNHLNYIVALGGAKQYSLNNDSHFAGVVAGKKDIESSVKTDIPFNLFTFSKIGDTEIGVPSNVHYSLPSEVFKYFIADDSTYLYSSLKAILDNI